MATTKKSISITVEDTNGRPRGSSITENLPVKPIQEMACSALNPESTTANFAFHTATSATSPSAESLKKKRSIIQPNSLVFGEEDVEMCMSSSLPKDLPMPPHSPSSYNPQAKALAMLGNLASRLEMENQERSQFVRQRQLSQDGDSDRAHIYECVGRIYETDKACPMLDSFIKIDSDPVVRKATGAAESLALLKKGNEEFVQRTRSGTLEAPEQLNSMVALMKGQKPFAILVTCSDSRVPPELVFGQGLGDLFVIRLAGNTIDSHARASILYAVHHLNCPLVIVMGHQSCGAVNAAFLDDETLQNEPEDVQNLVEGIRCGLFDLLEEDASQEEKTICAVVCNVHHQVRCLQQHPDFRDLIGQKKIMVVGAYYGFNGAVTFFDEKQETLE